MGRSPGTDPGLTSSGLPLGFWKSFWVLEASFRPSCFPFPLSPFLPPALLSTSCIHSVRGPRSEVHLTAFPSFSKVKKSKRKKSKLCKGIREALCSVWIRRSQQCEEKVQQAGAPLLETRKRNWLALLFLSMAWELGNFLFLFVGLCPSIIRLYYFLKVDSIRAVSEKYLFILL